MSESLEATLVTLRERRKVVQADEANMRAALKAAVRDAVAAGMTEKRAADLAGVTRMTVRAWLGKDKR